MPGKPSLDPSGGTARVLPGSSAQNNYGIGLFLILTLAAVLRLYDLGSVPHGFTNDEAYDGISARQAIEEGPRVFYPENNGREGLYINLSAPFVMLLGNSIWAMRLPAAIFGILTVWVTYLLGAELFTKRIGLLGALFEATSTWHLHNSRLTSRANAAPFFLVLALYLVFQTAKRVKAERKYTGCALLAGAVYGLGFHTYTSFRLTPILMLVVGISFGLKARREGWLRKFRIAAGCFAGAAAAVTFPLALYFWNHPESFSSRAAQVSVFSMPNPWLHILENCWAVAQMFYWRGDLDWKNNIPGEPELFLPVGILFAVGLWILLSTMVRSDRARDHSSFPYTLMLIWMATGAAASIFTQDQIHALRTSLMIPPVFLVAGLGAQRVYTGIEGALPRGVRIAGVVGFVWLVCYQPFPKYFRDWASDAKVEFWFSAWLTEEAKEIHNAPPVPAKYVVVPNAKNGERDVAPGQVPLTVIFLTQASTKRDRERSNVHFVLPGANDPGGAEFCAQVKKQHEGDQVFCVANDLPLRP